MLSFSDLLSSKVFVFDFDGTIVDSNAIKKQAFFDIASEYPGGFEAMEMSYNQKIGDRVDIWNRWYSYTGMKDGSDLGLAQKYTEVVDEAVIKAHEIPGAVKFIKMLRANGRRVFVSSATPEKNLKEIISKRGWSMMFEDIFGRPKTKVQTLNTHILDATTLPTDVCIIGDGKDDQASALVTGCNFIKVLNNDGKLEIDSGKHSTFDELSGSILY